MTEYEKMAAGQPFDGQDNSIIQVGQRALNLLLQINGEANFQQRLHYYQSLFAAIGPASVVQIPFHCEFGQSITIGAHSFINMNVTMLDGAAITIGDNVLIGPNCQFYTPSHSLDYRQRRNWETICQPITVESDVWIGGNCIINQGVTIGARAVIAANSVVTQNVPADTLYGGTPAKMIRALNGC